MKLGVALGILFYVLVNLVTGVRLLWLGRRARKVPEAMLGVSFLASGAVGFALVLVANVTMKTHYEWREPLLFWGLLIVDIGLIGNVSFVRFVFRPQAIWALLVAGGLVAAVFGPFVWDGLVQQAVMPKPDHVSPWIGNVARLAIYGWGSVEGLLYYGKLRRRLSLGLADPVVTNRFVLWSVGELGALAITLTATSLWVTGGSSEYTESFIALYALLGFVTSCANWMVFFPPPAYVRWLRRSRPLEQAKAACPPRGGGGRRLRSGRRATRRASAR